MSDGARKISVNVDPALGVITTTFFEEIQGFVNRFIAEKKYHEYINDGRISLTWYSDAPVSEGVSVGVNFSVLEGIDFVHDLVVALRKNQYQIRGVTVGY